MTTKNTDTITLLHTADWHIRDTQYGRGFRGEDFRRSVDEVIDIAISNDVDFIINGGDTFQINRPSGPMLDTLFAAHSRLKEAKIPMFTVTGNHDRTDPSYLSFPAYSGSSPEEGGIVCIDNRVLEFKGISIAGFPADDWRVVQETLENKTVTLDIVVWHGAVDAFVPFPMEGAWEFDKMPVNVARAWLLGDIHLPGRKRLKDNSLVAYPGPIELCDRGEPARKHVDIYTLDAGWREAPFPEPIEIELDTRPVVYLTVNDEKEADQALGRIREAVLESPDRPPLVFMSHARSMKSFVVRARELLDLRNTVFRAAVHKSNFKAVVHRAEGGNRPSLLKVVDQVVPPGTPINAISRTLSDKDANVRHALTEWMEKQLLVDAETSEKSTSAASVEPSEEPKTPF